MMIFNSQISIVNHRLTGNGVVHLQCAKNTRKLVGPDMIVLHYTGGTSPMSSALFLTRPDVAASAHLVIGREGELVQLVPFNIEAWHAGRSWYAGRAELNHYSIGIELDNLGKLRVEGNTFVAECGRKVKPEDVHADCSGEELTYWHRYTSVQVRTLVEVCKLLESNYPIRDVVGHSDITNRKIDPGPALEFALGEAF
ncbi:MULTISPECIES: N-acetylmuramoyl-L-alanine amidase [Butyricimonas]|nr:MULTISPECIES: N-acetylmuramoyl-L-alanine amidase [Butyricimonas]